MVGFIDSLAEVTCRPTATVNDCRIARRATALLLGAADDATTSTNPESLSFVTHGVNHHNWQNSCSLTCYVRWML